MADTGWMWFGTPVEELTFEKLLEAFNKLSEMYYRMSDLYHEQYEATSQIMIMTAALIRRDDG